MTARWAASPFAALLRDPGYAPFALGNALSLTGIWLQRTAAAWLAWELTGASAWLGALALAYLGPTLAVAPAAGIAADRFRRLAILRATQSLALANAAALAALAAAGWVTIPVLLAFTLAAGALEAATQPARLALVPGLAPAGRLGNAIALNSVTFNLAQVVGPALAGAALAVAGPWLAFAGNAASFAGFLAALARLREPGAAAGSAAPNQPSGALRPLAEALGYLGRHDFLAPLFALLTALALLLRPIVDLLPGFVDRVFAGGPVLLAVLSGSIGLGALASGMVLGQLEAPSATRLVRRLLGTALGLAATLAAFLAAPTAWLASPALVAFGLCLAGHGITAQTLTQTALANGLRGRVMSLYGLLFRASPALGAAVLGPLGDWLGLRAAVALAIVAALALLARLQAPLRRAAPAVMGATLPG